MAYINIIDKKLKKNISMSFFVKESFFFFKIIMYCKVLIIVFNRFFNSKLFSVSLILFDKSSDLFVLAEKDL